MLEKQMTGHRVDRSICYWFWDYVVSQGGDSSKVFNCSIPVNELIFVIGTKKTRFLGFLIMAFCSAFFFLIEHPSFKCNCRIIAGN